MYCVKIFSNERGFAILTIMKDKWRNKLSEKNYIKINNIDRKPICKTGDTKKTFVNVGTNNTTGRINFFTGTGKRKKYLGVVIKWKIKTLDLPYQKY